MESMMNLKVLYVEDDEFARNEMRHFLKKRVGKVFMAANGIEGVEASEVYSPDIAIVDLLMPKMDGLTMIRKIREKGLKTKVIVLTSVKNGDTVIETVNAGIDYYIVKPIDFTELELKIKQIGEDISTGRGNSIGSMERLENKRVIEDNIKKRYIKEYKSYIGKGPRETVVHLLGETVTITSFGVLTVMERTLSGNTKNIEIIKQTRNVVYEIFAQEAKRIIDEESGIIVSFEKAMINPRKDMDQVVFTVSKR